MEESKRPPVASRDKATFLRVCGVVVLIGGLWLGFAAEGGTRDGCSASDAWCPGGFDATRLWIIGGTFIVATVLFGLAFWLRIGDD